MISEIVGRAWRLYRSNFKVLALAIVIVWLPLDLLSSYMDYFVFDPDDVRKSVKFAQFLESFFGIIATLCLFCAYTSYAAGIDAGQAPLGPRKTCGGVGTLPRWDA